MDLTGRVPVPGDPLAPRQAHLALPAPAPSPDPMLLDLSSEDGESVAKAKPKKPTAARDKSEKRVRRKKVETAADPEDMVSMDEYVWSSNRVQLVFGADTCSRDSLCLTMLALCVILI